MVGAHDDDDDSDPEARKDVDYINFNDDGRDYINFGGDDADKEYVSDVLTDEDASSYISSDRSDLERELSPQN